MNKQMVISVVLFILVLGGMFGYVHYKQSVTNETEQPDTQTPPETTDARFEHITRIDVKHFYIDGVHTYVGELPMPTPCDLLELSSQVQESYPETIVLNFSVINNSETCIQVETIQRFRTDASASAEASVVGYFMGREVDINTIPAAPSETPDEFELFIKG